MNIACLASLEEPKNLKKISMNNMKMLIQDKVSQIHYITLYRYTIGYNNYICISIKIQGAT